MLIRLHTPATRSHINDVVCVCVVCMCAVSPIKNNRRKLYMLTK